SISRSGSLPRRRPTRTRFSRSSIGIGARSKTVWSGWAPNAPRSNRSSPRALRFPERVLTKRLFLIAAALLSTLFSPLEAQAVPQVEGRLQLSAGRDSNPLETVSETLPEGEETEHDFFYR